MSIRLDAITDEARESRLAYERDGIYAVLPGADSSGERVRVLLPIRGVNPVRIFGGLRARQSELEAIASRRFDIGERRIKLLATDHDTPFAA